MSRDPLFKFKGRHVSAKELSEILCIELRTTRMLLKEYDPDTIGDIVEKMHKLREIELDIQ